MSENIKTLSLATETEFKLREQLVELFDDCPIPRHEILSHLGLFMNGPSLSRLLFMNELYQLQLPVHGNIMEFGVR